MSEIIYFAPEKVINSLMESHGYTREEVIKICNEIIENHKKIVESIETQDVE